MAIIKTYPFPNSTILRINSEKEFINTSPEYQRKGEVWNLQKKQLLIDSILNDYDIPKLYFHAISKEQKEDLHDACDYAIIDGRQRLEAIWGFMDGDFRLAEDFVFLADTTIQANNLSYTELASLYPKLKIRFDSFILPIILVETDDIDLIEDMFSRLNEAVPLNAAEKRNALGGTMARIIREVAEHPFFIDKLRINDSRYQFREIAARLLFIEYSLLNYGKILDTKKVFMDKMVVNYKEQPNDDEAESLKHKVVSILNPMNELYGHRDTLLRSQQIIAIYYLTFKKASEKNKLESITRSKLIDFNRNLESNRITAEKDITTANFDYLEFERLSQQGTNDSTSIRERTRILTEFLNI